VQKLYGNTKMFTIVPMQTTDAAALIGGGSIPYATGDAIDIQGYTGWGRMRFTSWAYTGASGVTVAGATGVMTFAPWHATYAYIRTGTPTHTTGVTGSFGVGSTLAVTVYDKPMGTSTAFTTRLLANTVQYEDRYFDADAANRFIGGTVTIAGTGGPKFAMIAEIEIIPKIRPTT